MNKDRKTCFLIAPIGSERSPQRKRTDRLERYILSPVAQSQNLKIHRADKLSTPGLITTQIMEYLMNADIVIADITDQNANVFYEMGIRHALRNPIIHIRYSNAPIPFDNSIFRTLSYGFSPEELENCVAQLIEFVKSAFEAPPDTPFSSSTESYLVTRGDPRYHHFRSLDVVSNYEGLRQQWKYLLSQAHPGVVYWGQTVGGTAFPPDAEELIEDAVKKGATIRLIINTNPPFSGDIISRLEHIRDRNDAVDFVLCSDAKIRIFGMSTAYALFSPQIDGLYGGIIIKDSELLNFCYQWFNTRFLELKKNET